MLDPIKLSQELIKYPSITPDNVGTIDFLANLLDSLGFVCHKFSFYDPDYNANVDNLYATLGNNGKNFCFAGHTDVVPPGDLQQWLTDPFIGTVVNERIYGRGTTDMKCAIAAFIAAIADINNTFDVTNWKNSISLLITGDEEGLSNNGTAKVLECLKTKSQKIDLCLIGEPSNPNFFGEMIKIGRRGSLNATLEIYGTQGHVAYPEYAHNPIQDFIQAFNALGTHPLDQGSNYFQPSNLVFTSVDVGNNTCNVIPHKVISKFNVRFNDNYNSQTLMDTIKKRLNCTNIKYNLTNITASESFINFPKQLCGILINAINQVTDNQPVLGTNGGTSDARFIQEICPVVEFGLIGNTAHQINEHVLIKDLYNLTSIYKKVICKHIK